METIEIGVNERVCRVYYQPRPRFLLVQPADSHDLADMEREIGEIQSRTSAPFLLTAFPVKNWNADLSPWPAPAVFGNQAFSGCAEKTLDEILHALLPALRERFPWTENVPTILGGYSLAGLFALWAGHTAPNWDGIAAASPSVWFPGFSAFAAEHPVQARAVYLSLGDREEKTRNPVMAQVGGCIRALSNLYEKTPCLKTMLEWNEGNHFRDAGARTGKAFAWIINSIM